MKRSALIMAGGAGLRMGGDLPKQFALLAGKPVIMLTMERFYSFDRDLQLVVVMPESHVSFWENLCKTYAFTIPHSKVPGGVERFHSVKNGLRQIDEEGMVFIHDAVRPLVTLATLERCFSLASEKGNAVPVVPVSESVRYGDFDESRTIDRQKVWLVQTPQTFDTKLIKAAYNQEFQPGFTDDASVLEHAGHTIWLTEGNRENIKLTWPEDMIMAENLLRSLSD